MDSRFTYDMTGFKSACAEYSHKHLSLDEHYQISNPSIFLIEATGEPKFGIYPKDRLIINRALSPREGQMVVLVLKNEFSVARFSSKLFQNQDSETGDFVWGVITTIIRDLP